MYWNELDTKRVTALRQYLENPTPRVHDGKKQQKFAIGAFDTNKSYLRHYIEDPWHLVLLESEIKPALIANGGLKPGKAAKIAKDPRKRGDYLTGVFLRNHETEITETVDGLTFHIFGGRDPYLSEIGKVTCGNLYSE